MRRVLAVLTVAVLTTPLAAPTPVEAQGERCLSRQEQRQAVRSGRAVRPGSLKQRDGGKVLRIDLCEDGQTLVWVVTLLRVDGRVVELVIDAGSGGRLR